MKVNKAGSILLVAYFELAGFQLTRQSYIGTRDKIELGDDVIINQTYGPNFVGLIGITGSVCTGFSSQFDRNIHFVGLKSRMLQNMF